MPTPKNNILEFNQYIKSDKMLYTIYADIEFLIKTMDICKNNLEKSSTTKKEKFLVDIQYQQFGNLII